MEIIKFILAFIGRLFFVLNTRDKWQLALTILGEAGTGKSKIVEFLRCAMGESKTSVIGNMTETIFGLAHHHQKHLNILEELGEHPNLAKQDWLGMVTGDSIEVRKKYQESMSVNWESTMLIVSNSFALWKDDHGQISRRLMVSRLTVPVNNENRDSMLGEKIKKTIGPSILMCIRAYHALVHMVEVRDPEKKDVRGMLPSYFVNMALEIGRDSNPMEALLQSRSVCYPQTENDREKVYIPKAGTFFNLLEHDKRAVWLSTSISLKRFYTRYWQWVLFLPARCPGKVFSTLGHKESLR